MNIEDMLLPANGQQESLRPYVGQPNPNNSILRNYRRPLEQEGQLDRNQGIEYTILNYLLQKYPEKKLDLLRMYRQKQGRAMDSELNNTLFNRGVDNNNLRMQEMNYLPSGDWNRTQGPMFPLPRRM